MVRDGRPLAERDFTESRRIGGRWLDDVVSPADVVRALDDGATLVLQSLHRHLPSVDVFCTALQQEISHLVQANAYLTPPGATGLAEHADRHHVFVIQLAGRKRWQIEGLGERILETGDVLYMPAGHRHTATATDETSLHLTIGVIQTSYRDVIERALRSTTPSFDDPLPIGFANGRDDALERFVDGLDERITTLVDLPKTLDAGTIADREVRRRPARRDEFDGIRRHVEADAVDLDSRLAWRHQPEFESLDDGRIRVRLDERELNFPASAERALHSIDKCTPVSAMPGIDDASRLVVARRLVRDGFCRVDRDD